MILTNKRVSYTVEHSNESIKLYGNIVFNKDNDIESFNGSFSTLVNNEEELEESLGNFDYNTNGETFNKGIYNAPIDFETELYALLNEAIEEIKIEVDPIVE